MRRILTHSAFSRTSRPSSLCPPLPLPCSRSEAHLSKPNPTTGLPGKALFSVYSRAQKPVLPTQVQNRVQQLTSKRRDLYPRIQTPKCPQLRIVDVLHKCQDLAPGASHPETVLVYGRVHSIRRSGSKLVFLDITQGHSQLQIVVSLNQLENVESSQFTDQFKLIRKGDHIAVRGTPFRTKGGQVSVQANGLPSIVSPSLHPVPDAIANPETVSRRRHLDLIINPQSQDLLRLRSRIDSFLRHFLDSAGFTSVVTPIITYGAGGALARPFETRATEFSSLPLKLRIAPELFLKRLVVGNMGPVYEIGPVFRNEGVDGTHNPEFTMCEFYMPYANLDTLMETTERLLRQLHNHLSQIQKSDFPSLRPIPYISSEPFPCIEFLPTIQRCLKEKGVPITLSLSSSTLVNDLLGIHRFLEIPWSKSGTENQRDPSPAQLLDSLASHLIEPLCSTPTWIIHQPALMSPLAKSFQCPRTGERVAARAELFINSTEFVNCYEEENDPIEQERKFRLQEAQKVTPVQSSDRDAVEGKEAPKEIDESYIEALEWGLPPTGGWGCGVDRLVMYFGNTNKISDVLSFGSLRHVVTIGKAGRKGLD